jgi:uncharacterized phage protein (TIGR02220 family)
MHQGTPYGYLIVNGKVINEKGIQRLLGLQVDQVAFDKVWKELTEHGVVKKDENSGAYYSKRMVQDYEKFSKEYEINPKHRKLAEIVISYLNGKAKKNFDIKDDSYIEIIARKLEDGYIPDDFKKVINIKYDEWNENEKMNAYLHPETLFGNKFEKYLKQVKESRDNFTGNTINKR